MKSLLIALFLSSSAHALESQQTCPSPLVLKQYVQTIFQDPTHPRLGAGMVFTSRLALEGGVTAVALVYHAADTKQTLLPDRLLEWGVQPVSWALNAGVGGSVEKEVVVPLGFTINLTPTLLGPILKPMRSSKNPTVVWIANLVDSPSGGVAFGPQWAAYPIRGGVIQPLNHWRFPPRWFVGGLWKL